jgi:hypothetical protein
MQMVLFVTAPALVVLCCTLFEGVSPFLQGLLLLLSGYFLLYCSLSG